MFQQQQQQQQKEKQQQQQIGLSLNSNGNAAVAANMNVNMNGNGVAVPAGNDKVKGCDTPTKLINKLKRRMDEEYETMDSIRNNKKYLSQTMADRIGVLSLDDNNDQMEQSNRFGYDDIEFDFNTFTPSTTSTTSTFTSNLNNNNNNMNDIIFNNNNNNTDYKYNFNNNNDNRFNSFNNSSFSPTPLSLNNKQLALIPDYRAANECLIGNKPKNDVLERLKKSESNYKMMDRMPSSDIKSLLFGNGKPLNFSLPKPKQIDNPENKNLSLILYTEPKEIIDDSIKKQPEKRKEQQNKQKKKLDTVEEEDEELTPSSVAPMEMEMEM